jgi:hypothetical protein
VLKADPTRHRLVMDALAESLRESEAPTVARPRVVTLDPDDHDRVALLNIRFRRGKSRSDVENMQAALREFLTDETREAAETAECSGICLSGHDIGLPSGEIAYPHPDCPIHGADWIPWDNGWSRQYVADHPDRFPPAPKPSGGAS